MANAYSFLSIQCALVGPGGNIQLGAGAMVADEGLTFEANEDINAMTIAADGGVMHSLHANKSRTATVRLLKTSPINQQLANLYNFQTSSAANHGQNTMTLVDTNRQDVATAQKVAFKKGVPLTWAKDPGFNEWTFDVGIFDATLGAN